MRFLRIVPFVAIVLLTASAQNEYLEQLELEIEAMDETMADDDAFPDLEFFTGMLQAGATEGIPLLLVGGTSYQIVGVCDTDCSDLDLVLYDRDGEPVAEDILPDDVPIIEVTVARGGTYLLDVSMITCEAEPCYWGVQPYSTVGGAGGGNTGGGDSASEEHDGELRFGDQTLDGGEYFDTYPIAVRAGQMIEVDLRSDDFDTSLILTSPTGDAQQNDDFEGSLSPVAHRARGERDRYVGGPGDLL